MDAQSGLVHTMVTTAAFGDAGYRGVDKREEAQGPQRDVAMQPGKQRQLDPTRKWARLLEKAEQLKASIEPRSSIRST